MKPNPSVPVPEALARARTEMHGAAGADWLGRLPTLVAECARRWSLDLQPPFAHVVLNYVAPGRRVDGRPVVLKVCYPSEELLTEVAALRLYAGRGAVRLLAVDLDRGAFLLERLAPGTSLHGAPDDRVAIAAAVGVMRRLWRPVPPAHPFPSFADWVRHMAEKAPRFAPPAGPFPAHWLDRAVGLFADLGGSAGEPVVLHGDLHHGNVLAAEREPWLAIDPKGVVGEPGHEIGPLLLNALPARLDGPEARQLLAGRLSQLAEELGLDRARLRDLGVVRAVLSGFWSLEDHGHGWEEALAVAEVLAGC